MNSDDATLHSPKQLLLRCTLVAVWNTNHVYCYFGQSPVGGGVNSAAALAAPSPHLICTFKYSQYFSENWNLPARATVIVPTQDKFKF